MGLVVPQQFSGISSGWARQLSAFVLISITPSGTPGPAFALLEAGLDRSSPP